MRGNGGQNIQINSEVFMRQLPAKSCPARRRGQPDVCLRSNLVSFSSRPLLPSLADEEDAQLRTMATTETSPLLDTPQDSTAAGEGPDPAPAATTAPTDFIVWNPPSDTAKQTSSLGMSSFSIIQIF